ncbi:PAS domain S-box protein [Pseudocolwellia sp. HL-MZ19]
MVVLSPEGNIVEVNELALTLQGMPKVDYVGKSLWKSPTWCDFPQWESIWKQRLSDAKNQQNPVITEDVFETDSGSLHYAEVSTTAICANASQQVSGYVIQAVDTTKRRRIEIQNQKNEARLEFILKQSHIGHWELNLIDRTSYRSITHDKIFGYETLQDQWTYKRFIEHVIPDERDNVETKFQQAISNKTDWNIECQILRKDGETRWIIVSGGHSLDVTGQPTLMVGVVLDITDLKQAEINKLHHNAELESLFNALPDTYLRIMPDGTILDYRTQNTIEPYKNTKDLVGKHLQDILPEQIAILFQLKINEAINTNQVLAFEYQLMINNQCTHFEARLNRIPLNDQLICVIRDITSEFISKKSLDKSEQLFRTIFDQAAVGVALIDFNNGNVIRINQRYCEMVGYSLEEITSCNVFHDLTHPNDIDISLDSLNKLLSGEIRESTIEKRYIHKKGHTVWVETTISATWESDEQPQSIIVVIQDISARKKAEQVLQLSSRVFSDTQEGIMIIDEQRHIVDVNPAFVKITGYDHEEIIGESPLILSSGQQTPQFYNQMWESVTTHGHWQGEVWNRTKHGELYSELLNISSVKNKQNEVTHFVAIFSDITNIKHQQDKLNLMAHYDVLTKLPNRALFIDRFHQSIAHSKRTGHQLAICFLDLDNFKPVNDTYGHEAGDKLLIEVADRITNCIRKEDTVSRQGGDEFAILLNDIKSASQYEITIQRIHQSLALPYFINGIQHNISASSGVTLYPSDNGDIDTLLRHADHAMYQSKLSGKHRSQLYNPDSDQQIIKKNLQLEEIEQALIKREFQLYYQPKVNMITGKVFGVEALIRWFHPQKGLIPPLDFLPYIDGTPLERMIGEWVIDEALQQLDDWQKQGIRLEVSVNISSNHLVSPSFFNSLEKSLAAYPSINAKCLQLEILESSALGDLKKITEIIQRCLNLLGVSASLDDFGTGYSSLTHLRSLPVSTIKIDQTFVRDMLDDPSDYSIIDGVISLSKSFKRSVIAEGVETTNHGLMLICMGCEQAQGYGIAKPMPAKDFNPWLSNYMPNKQWLNFGNKQLSYKESSVEIFKLITAQWKDCFIKKIVAPSTDVRPWPIIDSKECHCGNWIRSHMQEQLFANEMMLHLESIHKEIHVIAKAMQLKYQSGQRESARSDLTDFVEVFKILNQITENLIK